MPRKQRPLKDRFAEKYVVDAITGCWNWTSTVNGGGYGTIGLGTRSEGKDFAHRVSYRLHCGDIPDGMVVCHKCDNRRCVNPEHLFLGSQQDNLDDAKSKARIRVGENWATPARLNGICKGEEHGQAKLTEVDVRRILQLHAIGLDNTSLARRFGVTRRQVRNIVNRKNWKHVSV